MNFKFYGPQHFLEMARTIYGVPEEHLYLSLNNEHLQDNQIPVLLGAPWDHQGTIKQLEDAGFIHCAVQPLDAYKVHQALKSAGNNVASWDTAYQSVRADLWFRDWYAYPLMVAVAQAERMGIKKITAIEFGVWRGEGLLNLASIARALSDCTEIAIEVVGFDTGAGLPSVADWRDHPELWYSGELIMPDPEALRLSLPDNCRLILGDIKNTLGDFIETVTSEAPIGFVALDVDTYSSSVDSLKIFDIPATHLLPATLLYLDDSYINIMQSEYSGEALAVAHFNDRNSLRKIAAKKIRPGWPEKAWHHAMYFAHIFDHPARSSSSSVNFIGLNVHQL